MRYGRNLADGQGLVWNAGERVEGYTSLGWTMVMAGVHLLPIGDERTSLAVKIVNWLLACWVIVLTDRLLEMFVPQPGWARLAVLVPLALCADLVFWSANGFETTLLTVVFLQGLVFVLRDAEERTPRARTFLLIGLLPIARSDAYHLWAALLLLAFGTSVVSGFSRTKSPVVSGFSRTKSRLFILALLAPALQLLFRHSYYGDWLPNTYYLKVAGIHGLFWKGAAYLKHFAETYAVPSIVAAAGIAWSRDVRLRWIAVAMLFSVANVLIVGGDIFPHFRYLAPWVPVLLVVAAAAAFQVSAGNARAVAVLLLLTAVSTTIQAGAHGRGSLVMDSGNGNPEHGLVAGLLIRKYTSPRATIAVVAAGNVAYFSRRPAIDLLGKTDAHIAHLPPRTAGPIGHSKFDLAYSLSRAPDLLVTPFPEDFRADYYLRPEGRSREDFDDYASAILGSPLFIASYRDYPVPLDYLRARGMVYVRGSSSEARGIGGWVMPAVRE